MHILVVNDDGPPSRDGSPFVHSLVNELKAQGHFVTVVLPNRQRSWIGKAHFVGEIVRPTYYYPDRLFQSNDPLPLDHSSNEGNHHEHPWVLVNSTPAGCVQIGLYHSHALHRHDQGEERPNPVDLVISGPNLGANTTTLFSLSSGTIGGALEAALCGKRSIALSFEPPSKLPSYDSDMITEASRHSVRLINYLYHNWDEGVELYSINVPLQPATTAAGERKVMYSRIRPNRWLSESPFREVSSGDTTTALDDNDKIQSPPLLRWEPDLADIHGSTDRTSDMDDDWMVRGGKTSVTPLKANFMHAVQAEGEIELDA
ncbi:sure-like protein [Aspergillus niger ATCC 13496]|uniref:Sure-like protein n=1 Tax=Aspergillus niger ATCC 13496 TaxID=1353008 RepID=A0A370C1Q4_ASPNG|nr:sure-like protein [Aspergillus niger ATCC 13496]